MPVKSRVTSLYIAFQFFFDLLIWLPIFYEFQKRMGLSSDQILGIQSLHYLAFCFLEVPTGYYADRVGYRTSLRSGALIFVISNLLVIGYPTYTGFLSHFLLVALSRSLISGAANAYLYEFLKMRGAKNEYREIEGRARAFGLIGKIVCWAMVGTLMSWHLTLPYWLTAASGFVAFVIVYYLPALPVGHRLTRLEKKHAAFRESVAVLRHLGRNPYLFLIMIQGLGVFMLLRMQVTFFQPILENKSFALTSFGGVMAIMAVFEAIGSGRAGWIQRRLSDVNAVFLLTSVVAISFFIIALAGRFGTIAGLCLFSYAMGLAYPIQKQLINDAITEPTYRATLLSIESMMDRLISAGVIALLTGFVTRGEMSSLLNTAGFITLTIMIALAIALRFLPDDKKQRPFVTALSET